LESFPMPLKSLHDLFVHFLRDIYYAERQILKAVNSSAKRNGSSEPDFDVPAKL